VYLVPDWTEFDPLIQALCFILIAPGAAGMLRWMKTRLQGRAGAPVLQPYRDIFKLVFRRRGVYPQPVSWVFQAAPLLAFGCYVYMAYQLPVFILPRGVRTLLLGPPADLLILAYLLGLARFASALGGMDSHSPYAGMGAGRAMFLHALVEPAFIVCIYALAVFSGSSLFSSVIRLDGQAAQAGFNAHPTIWLAMAALLIIMLVEAGRLPFDHPTSHLELGMLDKAGELEYSGPLLALQDWAGAMRLLFFMTLIVNLFLPFWLAGAGDPAAGKAAALLLYGVKLLALLLLLAVWEITRPRMRLRAIAAPAGLALAFAALAVVVAVLFQQYTSLGR
jgi:formate hydrogenlyase subunit 4